jgi:hypothetical protein
MKRLSSLSYLTTVLAVVVAALSSAGLLNRAINPYSLFASDISPSAFKPDEFRHLRLVKAYQVRHRQPEALIMGTSRAASGLNPADPSWERSQVYNLGLPGAGIYEIKRYFEHACAVSEVEQAVLILDFFSFGKDVPVANDYAEQRLAASTDGRPNEFPYWKDWAIGLFSWDASSTSIKTLLLNGKMTRYEPNGFRNSKWDEEQTLARGGAKRAFELSQKGGSGLLTPDKYQADPFQVDCLASILDTARAKQIDLRLAIGPTHQVYLDTLVESGHWEHYLKWMRIVHDTVESEATRNRAEPFLLVDFNGHHGFNQEAIPESGLATYYSDPFHFTPLLGSHILELLLGDTTALASQPAGSFGVVLTRHMIDRQIDRHRSGQEDKPKAH